VGKAGATRSATSTVAWFANPRNEHRLPSMVAPVLFMKNPAQLGLAKPTGAESYIKIAKYILLFVLSVYAVVQS
jgi:hypothetical protein